MRFDDLIKKPARPQRPLSYTESLQAKLDAEMATKPLPKFTAVEWAIMEGGGSLDEGWKDVAAAGALATGLAFGGGTADAKPVPQKPVAVQTKASTKVAPAKITPRKVAPVATTKAPVAKTNVKSAPKSEPIATNGLSDNSIAEHELQKAAIKAGIRGTELAQFMAQTRHESADFSRMKEIGGEKYFNKLYDPKVSPKTAKILGNTKVGDGIRYHGRGFIQITGRDNYRMAGQALGLPLEQQPELASRPAIAAKIAVWYWQTRVKPFINNFADTASVTKKINPAMRGLQDRHEYFKDYIKII